MTLQLPAQIHGTTLLSFLALLSTAGCDEEIRLDFADLRRVTPGGIVGLTAANQVKFVFVAATGFDDDRVAIQRAPAADLLREADVANFLALSRIRFCGLGQLGLRLGRRRRATDEKDRRARRENEFRIGRHEHSLLCGAVRNLAPPPGVAPRRAAQTATKPIPSRP